MPLTQPDLKVSLHPAVHQHFTIGYRNTIVLRYLKWFVIHEAIQKYNFWIAESATWMLRQMPNL
jgi:hypothetical protein